MPAESLRAPVEACSGRVNHGPKRHSCPSNTGQIPRQFRAVFSRSQYDAHANA